MEDMGPRPLYLQKHVTRHGKVAWYVRVKRGPLVRLHADYGTEPFWDEYRAAIAGLPLPKAKANSASLQWLYDQYRETMAWSKLSNATRRQRENIFKGVMEKAGNEAFKGLDAAAVIAGLDDRRATPSQARNYLDAVQGLFRWAKAKGHVETDPTLNIDRPAKPRGGPGFHVWNELDVAAFRKRWPLGTRQRLWMELILCTGLRRGDVVRAGKLHIKDGMLSMETEKTGEWAHAAITPALQAILDGGPAGAFHFVCGGRGEPLTKESFGNVFKDACLAAGLENKSAHGLRKLASTRDAEAGHSDRQLEAKYAWTGGYMASLYTRSANRKQMAKEAALLLPVRERVLPENSGSEINDLEANKISLVRPRKVP